MQGVSRSPAKPPIPAAGGSRTPNKRKGATTANVTPPARPDATPLPLPPKPRSGDEFTLAGREAVRPPNQLVLTDKELEEEIVRTLTSANPNAPHNLVRYNFRERQFKSEPLVEHVTLHYVAEGCLQYVGGEAEPKPLERAATESASKLQNEVDGGLEGGVRLRNQFNFCERAAQTPVYPPVGCATATEPPCSINFSGCCTPSQIYDSYLEDQERQRHDEDLKKEKAAAAKKSTEGSGEPSAVPGEAPPRAEHGDICASGKEGAVSIAVLAQPLEIVERMLDQNSQLDLIMDFKYWNDPADAIREGEGTLVPLWTFNPERVGRHKEVTALAWSPVRWDMFAAAYGSFSFHNQGTGGVAVHSLKKPSHPTITIPTESGAMCLDFHPGHPNMLAVGLYDGRVAVYDLLTPDKPMYCCTTATGKHSDAVWQVRWQADDGKKHTQLISVSGDGRITQWSLAKNDMLHQDLMALRSKVDAKENVGDEGSESLEPGTAMAFNPDQDHLFVVGTEEGHIHKCSTASNSEVLSSYEGHAAAVHALHWNTVDTKIFISSSADWSVRLWDASEQAMKAKSSCMIWPKTSGNPCASSALCARAS
eukprot:jgi/Botrbrau1/4165/Bobra.0192s0032.2